MKETNGRCLNLLIISCIVVYILIFQVEVIWTYFDLYFSREMVLLGNFTACRVPAIIVSGCFIISLHLL